MDIRTLEVQGDLTAYSTRVLENPTVKEAIAYAKKYVDLGAAEAQETTVLTSEYYEEDTKVVEQTNIFVRLNDQAYVNVLQANGLQKQTTSEIVEIVFLTEENGQVKRNIAFYQEGKLEVESSFEHDTAILEIPQDPQLGEDLVEVKGPVPCFDWTGGGECCKFRKYGLIINPLVTYKWCGEGCGSGTPVNALDTCCKSHDSCYGSNKSYPGRCSCDTTLINCAKKTDNAGSDRVVVAFQAKKVVMGC